MTDPMKSFPGCPCDSLSEEKVFFCEKVGKKMYRREAFLCRTRDDYHQGYVSGSIFTNQHPSPRPVNLDLAELKMAAERLAGETGDPTVVAKIAHYRKAVTRWTLAGFPTRTDEEVATIHADHCVPCQKYDAEQKVCTKCGCGVTKTGMAAFNKLRMATESCPLGKW